MKCGVRAKMFCWSIQTGTLFLFLHQLGLIKDTKICHQMKAIIHVPLLASYNDAIGNFNRMNMSSIGKEWNNDGLYRFTVQQIRMSYAELWIVTKTFACINPKKAWQSTEYMSEYLESRRERAP